MIRENLKVAQSQQKSYADKRRRDLSFEIGDFVYLKVSPMRGTRRFKVKGKLAPRYVSPFKIISRKGEVAYQLELPPQLSVCSRSLATREKLLINSSYRHNCQMYTMYFLCRSSRNVCKFPRNNCQWKSLTCHTVRGQVRFWIWQSM
jgi:hypothetical protein